jgi:hypothetical protein
MICNSDTFPADHTQVFYSNHKIETIEIVPPEFGALAMWRYPVFRPPCAEAQ